MSLALGIIFHAAGASCAAVCYTPQKKILYWSWQTFWLMQAFVCWLLLPVLIGFITVPHLLQVLKAAPVAAMWKSFALGAVYGIGGTAFGVAIRYVGFSFTYAISIGVSCVLGTLLPPMLKGNLGIILNQPGGGWLIAGISAGVIGIALCGIAGRYKEQDLRNNEQETTFLPAIGIPLCLLAGILSAVYGIALDQGQPIADVAAKFGAGNFQSNVVYIFTNAGAFFTTMVYCIHLHRKQGTFTEYIRTGFSSNAGALAMNYQMAIITGILWYSQFFLYGLGHIRMGQFKFSSWGIHMIMLVLFSALAGLILKEWLNCRPLTIRMLVYALLMLISAVLLLAYGNYAGSIVAGHLQ